MPRHDPVPPSAREGALDWPRYKRLMKWMALASFLAVLAALAWLHWSTDGGLGVAMAIAATAGVGLSVLLGTALMGLVFLSNRSGHDEAASGQERRP